MNGDVEKLVADFTNPDMTRESRANVLAYARGLLDAQRELKVRSSGMADEAAAAGSGRKN
jgi:hypothetical protein